MAEQRRICWPNPDAVCLQGGCGYCNTYRFRNVTSIEKWVDKQHRPELTESFQYGQTNNWFNANSRSTNTQREETMTETLTPASMIAVLSPDTTISITYVEMTPDYAAELLDLNTNNRNANLVSVERIARYIRDGMFYFNGASVVVSNTGVLLDGQHRLMAIVKTGMTAPILLVEGVQEEALKSIDQGKPRSTADILTLDGVGIKNVTAVGSIARNLVLFGDHKDRLAQSRDRMFLADVVKKHAATLEEAATIGVALTRLAKRGSVLTAQAPSRPVLVPAVIGTLVYLMIDRGANAKYVEEFFTRVLTGVPDPDCPDVFIATRSSLVNSYPLNSRDAGMCEVLMKSYDMYIRAYNSWRKGEIKKRIMSTSMPPTTHLELTDPVGY